MSHLRHGGVGRDAGAADEEGDAEVVFVDLQGVERVYGVYEVFGGVYIGVCRCI